MSNDQKFYYVVGKPMTTRTASKNLPWWNSSAHGGRKSETIPPEEYLESYNKSETNGKVRVFGSEEEARQQHKLIGDGEDNDFQRFPIFTVALLEGDELKGSKEVDVKALKLFSVKLGDFPKVDLRNLELLRQSDAAADRWNTAKKCLRRSGLALCVVGIASFAYSVSNNLKIRI